MQDQNNTRADIIVNKYERSTCSRELMMTQIPNSSTPLHTVAVICLSILCWLLKKYTS